MFSKLHTLFQNFEKVAHGRLPSAERRTKIFSAFRIDLWASFNNCHAWFQERRTIACRNILFFIHACELAAPPVLAVLYVQGKLEKITRRFVKNQSSWTFFCASCVLNPFLEMLVFFALLNILIGSKKTQKFPVNPNPERVGIIVPVKNDPSISASSPYYSAQDYPEYFVLLWTTRQMGSMPVQSKPSMVEEASYIYNVLKIAGEEKVLR